jgi:hypothetical protein
MTGKVRNYAASARNRSAGNARFYLIFVGDLTRFARRSCI